MENKYYVYQHVDTDGTIVYTGMGSNHRAWCVHGRSREHKEWMISRLPSRLTISIVSEGLSRKDAFALEHSLLYQAGYKFNKYCLGRKPAVPVAAHRHNRVEVLNKDTGEIFESIVEAAKEYGVHPNTIRNAMLGKKHQHKAAGYSWGYYGSD